MAKWICKDCNFPCNLETLERCFQPHICVEDEKDCAWIFIKETGCPACDKLPGVDRCLKCQKEEADAEVVKAMDKVEEIEQKLEQERNNSCEVTTSTETALTSKKPI